MLGCQLEAKPTLCPPKLDGSTTDSQDLVLNLKDKQDQLATKEHHLRLRKNAVHVRNLPNGATKEGLIQYFKKFGDISCVEMGYRDTRASTGTPRYCLVIVKDDHTYQAILSVWKHRFKGKDIFCTPCVKGSRSLASLSQIINSKKIVLRQKVPLSSCFGFAQFQKIVSEFGFAVDAHYLRGRNSKETKVVALTFDQTQDARKISTLKALTGCLEGVFYHFEIEPYNSAEVKLAKEFKTENKLSAGLLDEECPTRSEGRPLVKQGDRRQTHQGIFPPFHRYLPCRYNYYTKRIRFGGSALEHQDQNLRFNKASTGTTERVGLARPWGIRIHEPIPEIPGEDNLFLHGSGWSSVRTLTPTKHIEADLFADPVWYAKPVDGSPLIQ